MSADIPPLSPTEVRRLLTRLSELTDAERTVVVGGQAVHFWAYFLSRRDNSLLDGPPPTSKDLDLCGTREAVIRAAELLGGEAQLPSLDRHTPNAGIVRFEDSDGNERILDIITAPYGLRRDDVVKKSLRVQFEPSDSGASVHFRVMNPIHCMQSRVHNVAGLRLRDRHGLHQLRVSIPCAREFLRSVLDTAELPIDARRRSVMAWNQRIFRFARSDRDAQAVYREHGIDPFDAVVVDDDRLSPRFREDGYQRWRSDLHSRRRRARHARERRSAARRQRG